MEGVPEVYGEIAELCIALDAHPLSRYDACWEHQIDDLWWVAVNGHGEERKTSDGTAVPPYSMYVKYNGWPAGIIDPRGGCIAAGEAANEDTLIAAVQKAKP